jgi:hypothetical protein
VQRNPIRIIEGLPAGRPQWAMGCDAAAKTTEAAAPEATEAATAAPCRRIVGT